jgi:hypothetical protein
VRRLVFPELFLGLLALAIAAVSIAHIGIDDVSSRSMDVVAAVDATFAVSR